MCVGGLSERDGGIYEWACKRQKAIKRIDQKFEEEEVEKEKKFLRTFKYLQCSRL